GFVPIPLLIFNLNITDFKSSWVLPTPGKQSATE
ncbi:unnamed protein product, partial [Didymodactylos carnosus]